jgi:hypothetical protein
MVKPPFVHGSNHHSQRPRGQEPRHLVQITTGQMTRHQGVLRPKTEAGPEMCNISGVSSRGTPSSHPFLFGIFPQKNPTIWGYPILGNLHIYRIFMDIHGHLEYEWE